MCLPVSDPAPSVRRSIKYVLVVTRKPDGWAPVSAQILLGEPRLARMRDPRVDTAVGATGTVIQASGAGAADALLWQIDDLGRAEARTLVFELDRWRFAVDNGLQLTVEEDDRKPGHFDVEIFNPAVAAITGRDAGRVPCRRRAAPSAPHRGSDHSRDGRPPRAAVDARDDSARRIGRRRVRSQGGEGVIFELPEELPLDEAIFDDGVDPKAKEKAARASARQAGLRRRR